MKRLMLLVTVAVLGCDYYGPKNPPPDPSPNPTMTMRTSTFTSNDPDGVDGLLCPSPSVATGGGCDCVQCGVVTGNEIPFAAVPAGNGFLCACIDGCPTIFVRCAGSTVPSTLQAGLISEDPEMQAALHVLRTQKADLIKAR